MTLPLIYHDNYSCSFPEDHRFVMSKFRRLYEHLCATGVVAPDRSNLFKPSSASLEELALAHAPPYLEALLGNQVDEAAWRRVGLPWSNGLIERTLTAPNGTLLSAKMALEHGIACHLAGGTHHAHHDFGSGFCMINDLAYTALSLLKQQTVSQLLIFDCDVHQGDGTATILADEPRAFTCSIHCEKNFPFRKAQSDLDVGLPLGQGDEDYLEVVENTLLDLIRNRGPELILYDAGVDVWQEDALGRLNISWQGIERRDRLVLKTCLNHKIPVATVIGGGYDKDHTRLARRHAIVVEQAYLLTSKSSASTHLEPS